MSPTIQPSPIETDAAIRLDGLTRQFGKTTAVDHVTFDVPAGTTCGFIGLNGAGKSTVIRMIVGLLKPTAGTITVAGCAIPRDRDRSRKFLGYVPDRPNVYPWMTGLQALRFCRAIHGPRWNVPLVDSVARSLRLDLTKQVRHMSKGTAAKLSLLLAIGHDPRVLVLDEPTSGFDPLARDEFLEGIITANTAAADADADAADDDVAGRPGRTVLFSSHSLGDVQRLCDSVAILDHGKLLLHEPVDRLLGGTKRLCTVVDDPARPTVAPPGTVRECRTGREWTVTVNRFSGDQVQFLREKNGVGAVSVQDLTLDEVFRDYVRGRSEPAQLVEG